MMPAQFKLPPQDMDAEQALMSACLLRADAVGEAIESIGRTDTSVFMDLRHRLIWPVLVDMFDAGIPVDSVTLKDQLRQRKLLDDVGGVGYFVDLLESAPSAWNARQYARIVKEKARLRSIAALLRTAADECDAPEVDPNSVLDDIEGRLFNLHEAKEQGSADFISACLEEVFAAIEAKEKPGIPTGYYKLDELTGGLQPGEVTIIAGRPSMGKTGLGACMAYNIAKAGTPILFFSMEMNRLSIIHRLLSLETGIDTLRIRRGMIDIYEAAELRAAADRMGNVPFGISDGSYMTPTKVRATLREFSRKHGVRVAVVDYLQLMHLAGRVESRQVEVSNLSKAMKAIARDLNVAMVVLAQLNRKPTDRQDNRPRMSDLRESGSLEQDADVVLLIHREEYYHKGDGIWRDANRTKIDTAELILEKQRNGPTGSVTLQFDNRLVRFSNPSEATDTATYTAYADSPVAKDPVPSEPPRAAAMQQADIPF